MVIDPAWFKLYLIPLFLAELVLNVLSTATWLFVHIFWSRLNYFDYLMDWQDINGPQRMN